MIKSENLHTTLLAIALLTLLIVSYVVLKFNVYKSSSFVQTAANEKVQSIVGDSIFNT